MPVTARLPFFLLFSAAVCVAAAANRGSNGDKRGSNSAAAGGEMSSSARAEFVQNWRLKGVAGKVLTFLTRPGEETAKPHKTLWPLRGVDLLGMALAAVVVVLASSSGIGGGGLLVPLYLIVLRFNTTGAVALSNITIVGGTLVNLGVNVFRHHPTRTASSLINWNLILIMEPSTILGAVAGGYINQVLPPWLTTMALAVLLAFITDRLYKRATALSQRQELAAHILLLQNKDDIVDLDDKSDIEEPLLSAQTPSPNGELPIEREPNVAAEILPHHLPAIRVRDARPKVPLKKLAVLFALLACVVASDLAKRLFACPSFGYWLSAIAVAPVAIIALVATRGHLLRRAAKHSEQGIPLEDVDDVLWTNKTTLVYPSICTFAGVCAGMFGVGGGIVKGPLMLEMGVPPEVAAATSATMIFFTSMSASVIFVSFGALPADYGAVMFVIGALFTGLGQALTRLLHRRLQKSSLVVWAMALIMSLSSLVLAVQGIMTVKAAVAGHRLWNWGTVCAA